MLPIGSVVTLKDKSYDGVGKDYEGGIFIITGYFETYERIATGDVGYFDYLARIYPYAEYYYDIDMAFNEEDIDEVLFTGYIDDEGRSKIEKLGESIKKEFRQLTVDEMQNDELVDVEDEDDYSEENEQNLNHNQEQEESILSRLFNL